MRSRDVILLTVAVVLVGVAQLLVLPPFEGFDETAHYSYIREVADTRSIPIFGRSTIATDVAAYRESGPMPYATVEPFNENGGWTYQTFSANANAEARYRERFRATPEAARRYQPAPELNWEAQHPPLYYALLAPIMRGTDRLPFNTQFFLLRLASYILTVFGLLIGLYGTLEHLPADARTARALIAGALLYPFLVPMFFPEFARLGNDSLCMLLVGITWVGLLRVVRRPYERRPAILLGIVLGLGLLTKAFFLPIGAGAIAFLLYRSFESRGEPALAGGRLQQALIVGTIALVAGGWWYAYKFLAFHSVTGSAEFITLEAQGGLIANLSQKFAMRYLARAFVALVASAYYTGTWSLTRLPELLYLPGLLLLALVAFRAALQLRSAPAGDPQWAPLWIGLPVFGGFLYRVLASIALIASGNNVGGWYFNVLAPMMTLLVGLGLRDSLRSRMARAMTGGLAAYALLFFVAGQWAQTALYAGCAIKTAHSKYYVFPDGWFCLTRLGDMTRTLDVIGWPIPAAVCFLLGIICLLAGLIGMFQKLMPMSTSIVSRPVTEVGLPKNDEVSVRP
jgi:hypothetical protein